MARPQLVWDQDEIDIVPEPPQTRPDWRERIATLAGQERERFILWTPVAFACGIGAYFSLPFEPLFYPLCLSLAFCCAMLMVLKRNAVLHGVLIALCLFLGGMTASKWRVMQVAAPVLEREVGPIWVEGKVVNVESLPRDDLRVTIRPSNMEELAPAQFPYKIRVTVRTQSPDLIAGDSIRIRAVLSPPAEPVSPGAFDFARQAYFNRLGGVGYAVTSPVIIGKAEGQFSDLVEGKRANLSALIRTYIKGDAGAIAAALLVGERGALSQETADKYRDAGLAHLLAISGLHFGLVAAALFFIARFSLALLPYAALNWPIKEVAAVFAWAGTLFYLIITGSPLPAQRAFIMTSIILLATILGRQPISLRLAGFAALVVLVLSPEALLSVSFQMSFAAVIALIAAYEAVRDNTTLFRAQDNTSWTRRATLYLLSVALSTIVAEVAIDPIAAFHFNRIARYGLFANVVAVPLTAFWIMPWGLAAMFLMPLGLEALALIPMGWGINLLTDIATTTADASGAVWVAPSFPISALALMCLGGLWLCIWRTKWRLFGLLGPGLGFLIALSSPRPDIVISNDGKMLGLRSEEGKVLISTKRGSRITKENWIRHWGEENGGYWLDDTKFVEKHNLRCDDLGCAFSVKGSQFVFTHDIAGLEDDCRTADIILTPLRVRDCRTSVTVIDNGQLLKGGAHALHAPQEGDVDWRIIPTNVYRGERPWVRNHTSAKDDIPSNTNEDDDDWRH